VLTKVMSCRRRKGWSQTSPEDVLPCSCSQNWTDGERRICTDLGKHRGQVQGVCSPRWIGTVLSKQDSNRRTDIQQVPDGCASIEFEMSRDDQQKAKETVIRGLLRLPSEMKGEFARLHQDAKFKSMEEFYSRLGSKKACGVTEASLEALLNKGLKYKVSGEKQEHISLRCPDCDMVDLEAGICKPTKGASFADCPFFDKSDPLDLHGAFKEVEAPAFRANKKPG
jgi:hypothetical protein